MGNENKVYIGTEMKLNISIEPLEGYTMDDYDFSVEIYVSPRKVVSVTKQDCLRVDQNNYIVLLDTNLVGVGNLMCKVTAHIPDEDFEDGLRSEVSIIQTGITIER